MSLQLVITDIKSTIFVTLKSGVLFFLLFFISCSPHTPNKNITPLVTGNESYSLASDGIQSQNRWWEALNDPVMNSLIEEALSANLTLKQIHARIEQAVAADKQAASFMFPELNAGASAKKEWEADKKAKNTYNTAQSAINAGIRRFRPIMLTAGTTFIGLAPMIFETSVQARFLIPMAISLGYGILFSIFVILLLTPALYVIHQDVHALFRKK